MAEIVGYASLLLNEEIIVTFIYRRPPPPEPRTEYPLNHHLISLSAHVYDKQHNRMPIIA